jgi:uncharacterized protein (AIM24 family)
VRQKNVSSALFGGQGLYQTLMKGLGLLVLYSPGSNDEIIRYELTGDNPSVDSDSALMHGKRITFRAEKSCKGIASSAVSGEAMLKTLEGPGHVDRANPRSI